MSRPRTVAARIAASLVGLFLGGRGQGGGLVTSLHTPEDCECVIRGQC